MFDEDWKMINELMQDIHIGSEEDLEGTLISDTCEFLSDELLWYHVLIILYLVACVAQR